MFTFCSAGEFVVTVYQSGFHGVDAVALLATVLHADTPRAPGTEAAVPGRTAFLLTCKTYMGNVNGVFTMPGTGSDTDADSYFQLNGYIVLYNNITEPILGQTFILGSGFKSVSGNVNKLLGSADTSGQVV